MCDSHRKLGSSGISLISMTVAIGVVLLALVILQMNGTLISTTAGKIRNSRFSVDLESGADTMLLAYRLAEKAYNEAMGGCASGDGQPFLVALKNGHGCTSGVGAIRVFSPSDAAGLNIAPLYDYAQAAGCAIGPGTGLQCGGKAPPVALVTVGKGTSPAAIGQRIDAASFLFTLNRVLPEKEIAEVVAEIAPPQGFSSRRVFAIRASLTNTAHIEADGRVTQENPDPLSLCPGKPWATMFLYDPGTKTCQSFAQLGGGTGLAYYKGRFFGFRPADGNVVDLLAASTSPSYLVDPATGATCLGCPQIFPRYDRDSLRDADDITVVGSQIYFVSGQGVGARIGGLSLDGSIQPVPAAGPAGTPSRVPMCPLGKLGWGQAYVGISATEWSDELLPVSGAQPWSKSATFFLKTDTGGLITATVLAGKGLPPPGFAPASCQRFKLGGLVQYWSCCLVFKDANLQAPEYYRTYGFERASDGKPYYLY